MTELSITSGRSVSPCTSGIAFRMSSISSASGSPTLTSSMSAPPSTCSATSISSCDRSPACNCAWNFLRPVGLIRSPITQNGCPGPMTTVLDRDWTTVSTHLPFVAGRDAESPAKSGNAGLTAEADQVQSGDARKRACVIGELARHLEALRLLVRSALTPHDRLLRDDDPGHVLIHVAQRGRRADEADRRQKRALLVQVLRVRRMHERREALGLEADLQLQEPSTRPNLLERAVDAVLVRRRARILDRADEELRCRIDLLAGEILPSSHPLGDADELDRVEVEDAPSFRLVTRGDVVTGPAADVLDPVQRRTCDVRLQREPVPVAAGQLHDGLHTELPQRDGHREWRCVCMRRGVVGRIRRIDV